MSVSQKIYDDSASFGLFTALIGAIIATIICVIFILPVSVYLITKKRVYTETSTNSSITSIQPGCTKKSTDDGTSYSCTVNYSFVDNNNPATTHESTAVTTSSSLCNYCNTGDTKNYATNFDVFYNPTDPDDSQLYSDDQRTLGWAIIAFGIFLLFIGWISYYIKRRYKFAAAAGGVATGVQGIAGAIEMVTK